MDLPYSKSKADPTKAQSRIRTLLMKFGVNQLSFDEDFDKREVKVFFTFKGYPVMIPLNVNELADAFMRQDPYTSRKRMTREEWKAQYLESAHNAAFSVLEDLIKSMITVISVGVGGFSFEEIFFSFFIGKDGRRMGEVIKERLPKLLASANMSTEGK